MAMNKTSSPMNSRSFLAGIALIGLATLAQAQWSWKDASGRRVFSDQPPPPSVSERDILKRPLNLKTPTTIEQTIGTATTTTLASTLTSTVAALPKASGKDTELEKKKKESEDKEATKKQAETERVAAAKKENCDRAKRSKAGLDSGVRISMPNAKGENEPMNDATRASETKRLQEIMASECS
jgi:uncharacterized membrane protein